MPINVSSELTAQQQITAIYVAYYDRAPDPAGIQFWVDQLEGDRSLEQIASDFSSAAETVEKYPYFETPELASADNFITSVYVNLFGRTPDSAGLDFWSDQLESGSTPVGEIILAIIEGAQDVPGGDDDRSTVLNKIDVGLDWATAAANAGVGTSSNLIAEDVDGNLVVHDPDAFTSATTVLDGVTGDPATVDAAKGDTDTFFEENVDIGETFNLTTGQDDVSINTVNTIDTVRGLLDDDGTNDNDTFTSGDIIEGNGLTEVRLTLVEVDSGTPDFVEMTGVNGLEFRGAGETGTVTFDASSYGTDLNNFMLSGGDGSDVEVDNVEFDEEGPLTFEIAEGTTGSLDVTGEAGPFTSFTVDMDTSGSEGAWVISDIGNAGISSYAGVDSDVDVVAFAEDEATSGNATIDAMTVGDVSLVASENSSNDLTIELVAAVDVSGDASVGDVIVGNVDLLGSGSSADASFELTMDASVSGSGNATVGNLTVADISLVSNGDDSDVEFNIDASASVSGTGDASVGDMVFGNITMSASDAEGEFTFDVDADARADIGNASIGDLTIGDVSFTGGTSNDSHDFDIDRDADVDVSGDATIGHISVGNITGVVADFSGEFEFSFEQDAYANDGSATVGDITLGALMFDIGEDTNLDIDVTNDANADNNNSATAGAITIGNIDLTQASGGDFTLDINMDADASGSGSGMAGNVTVGDITSVMDIDTSLSIDVNVTASGTGTMTAIGDVSIGNLTLSGPVAISADASLDVDIDSDGTIGAVTVGAVDVDFLADSTFDYDVDISAGTSYNSVVGAVLLGDVNIVADDITYSVDVYGDLTAGVMIGDVMLSGDDVDWNDISLYASADIGDVTIGNVMLDAATNLSISNGITISATGDVGNVDVGDVVIDFINSDSFSIDVYAGDNIGDVSIGNIDFTAAVTASDTADVFGYGNIQVTGDADVGNVTLGDITILNSGGGSNYGSNYVTFTADAGASDSLGNVTIGDIDLTSVALGFDTGTTGIFGGFIANIGGDASDVGDVVVGDISLNATAENVAANADTDNDEASPEVIIRADQGSTVSSMLVGDIDITLTNSVDDSSAFTAAQEYNVASASVSITSDSAITVGDINVSAINESTVDVQGGVGTNGLFDYSFFVGTGGDEDITFGDITVAGGGVDTADVALDNLGTLTGWLGTSGDTVTVGDIDYSAYTGAAVIDVSGYDGAANITAGSGGADITVNTTQNLVTLGAGDDTVFYEADEDSGTTYAEIDKISGFESGSDLIDFSADGDITDVDIAGAFADYDSFLVAAQNAMSFDSSIDVFVGNDGTNTYVAVESDDDASDTIDYAIELTGVTGLSAADFVV